MFDISQMPVNIDVMLNDLSTKLANSEKENTILKAQQDALIGKIEEMEAKLQDAVTSKKQSGK